MNTCVHLSQFLAEFFPDWEAFHTDDVEKIETHIVCSVAFSRKSYRLWGSVEEYGIGRQVADDSMAHALCMLDNQVHKHTFMIFIIYCFFTATIFTLTNLNVTLVRTYFTCRVR